MLDMCSYSVVVLLLSGAAIIASALPQSLVDNTIPVSDELKETDAKPASELHQTTDCHPKGELLSKPHSVTKRDVEPVISQGSEQGGLVEEGRKRRKGLVKKVVLPVFLSAMLMGAPIALGLVALAAFKGLWAGKTALFVTAALALRKLFTNHSVYVPPAPHHVTEFYGDYKRADDLRRGEDYRRGADDYRRPPEDFKYGW